MSQGFILIHRKITDSDFWFSEKFTRGQAWIDLLLLANHKEGHIRKRGIRIDVSRGCVGVAQETLATRWKWSRGKVKRFLNELEKDEKIVQQTNKATSLICIVNYDEYQGKQTPNGTTDEHQTNIKRTSNSTGTTMNNNVNNDKQEKALSGKPDDVAEIFEFWQLTMNHPNAKLDADRKKRIRNALKLGYSIDDLKTAIRGCAKTPHNMGQNDRGGVYDALNVILKNADNIDRFIKNDTNQPRPNNKSSQSSFNEGASRVLDSCKEDLNF